MKWYKHDADANMDARLQEVLLDYGLEGYGLYWYCLELITNKITSDNITFKLEHDARIIARNTGSSVQKVEEMMRKFVSLGLFEDSDGAITCFKLAKRLDKSMSNSPKMRAFVDGLRSSNVMTLPDNVMTPSENVSPEGEGEGEGDKNKIITLPAKPSKDSAQSVNAIFFKAGITEDQVSEIRSIRKTNKGGKITERIANELIKQFTIAGSEGWTLEAIFNEWASRGWKSFKAEWVLKNKTKQQARADQNSKIWDPQYHIDQLDGV